MSEAPAPYGLDGLLGAARDASPSHRIEFRDSIATHGEDAIVAMTDWLGEPRLAAFAIRVLERIGRQPATKRAVLDVFGAVDREELPAHLVGDVDQALAALGGPRTPAKDRRSGSGSASRPLGTPGVEGRGYWVMRTSQWERPYVWAEAQRGRLRQGWGWNAEMNLETIAELVRLGGELSDEQRAAWRARRMLASQPDGMRLGDVIVAPNIPVWGVLSVFRVAGSYEYSLDAPRQWDERFGHVLPVDLLVAGIDRRSPRVSDGLRAMLRPQTRLYNITGYGGDVERVLARDVRPGSSRDGEPWTESELRTLFGAFPPSGPRPTPDEAAAIATDLRRSVGAVEWQWADGSAYVSGRSASTTSDALKAWLDRQDRA